MVNLIEKIKCSFEHVMILLHFAGDILAPGEFRHRRMAAMPKSPRSSLADGGWSRILFFLQAEGSPKYTPPAIR
jgi:hypothetical protein